MFGLSQGLLHINSLALSPTGQSKESSCLCNKRFFLILLDATLILLLVVLLAWMWIMQPPHRVYDPIVMDFQPQTSEPLRPEGIQSYLAKIPHVVEVNCSVFMVHPTQWDKTLEELSETIPLAEKTVTRYDDCSLLTAGWPDLPVSDFEGRHPIAFSIMVYANLDRFARLLRAIYRKNNIYCVHIDSNSPQDFHNDVAVIASCFDNVYLTEESIPVYWGGPSVLKQEMICLDKLWKYQHHWEWVINLTGEEFPLKTNLELVHILSILGQFNDVWIDPCTHYGTNMDWIGCFESTFHGFQERWDKSADPPHYVMPYKGQIHFVLTKPMVDFVLHSRVAQEIYNWSLTTYFADEIFFSTINTNIHLGAPGASPDFPLRRKPSLARMKLWRINREEWPNCTRYLRKVCLLTPRELPILTNSIRLFANKFKPDHRPLGYACMEEWYFNKVGHELETGRVQTDLRPYHKIYYQYIGV